MLEGISRKNTNFNYDGTIGQKDTVHSISVALSSEQEDKLEIIKSKLNISLSELATSLENITVNISSLVGIKNILGEQIDPSTEQTLVLIKEKTDNLNISLTDLENSLKGPANKNFSEIYTELVNIINKLHDLTIELKGTNNKDLSTLQNILEIILSRLNKDLSDVASETTLGNIKANTDRLDINVSTLRDSIKGIDNKDLSTIQHKLQNIADQLNVALSTRASEATLSVIETNTSKMDVPLSSVATEITAVNIKNNTGHLDTFLSSRSSEITSSQIKTNTDKLDVSLSTRATEATLSSVKSQTDKLQFDPANRLRVTADLSLTTVGIENSTDIRINPATEERQTSGNTILSSIDTKVSTSANQVTGNTSLASIDTKIGEVSPTPTANTLLERLRAIRDAVVSTLNVVIQTGANVIGFVKNRPDFRGYAFYTFTSTNLAINASQTIDFIVPNGQIWHLNYITFVRNFSLATRRVPSKLVITWDPAGANQIITNLNSLGAPEVSDINFTITGDGVRILRSVITNGSEDASTHNGVLNYYREV